MEFEGECKNQRDAIVKDRKLMGQYRDMLREVKLWQPPTPDHEEFKKFMIQQIENSIEFDGMEDYYSKHLPQKLTGEEWLTKRRKEIQQDIDYHTKENDAEIERTNQRNKWIADLRDSLGH